MKTRIKDLSFAVIERVCKENSCPTCPLGGGETINRNGRKYFCKIVGNRYIDDEVEIEERFFKEIKDERRED